MKKGLLSVIFLTMLPMMATAQSKYIKAVDEYVPAPGQFVNVLPAATAEDTPATMAQKCTDAIAGENKNGNMITLGAWGGYVTFHFDHPVVNAADRRDFAIWGNAFENNAEPAIVFVSVDKNNNKLPDDEWYELRGSEYDNVKTIHDYQLTYSYGGEKQPVAWTDNKNNMGEIQRLKYHKQEYFPLWLTSSQTLTFSGCRLPDNAYLSTLEGSQAYLLPAFDYGYADNLPNENAEGCSFDIAWAVDKEGNPVTLDKVDFIRCQNSMNQWCGSIGETSTEITGAEDLHPDETVGISQRAFDLNTQSVYTVHGQRLARTQRGMNIIVCGNGKTKKTFIK